VVGVPGRGKARTIVARALGGVVGVVLVAAAAPLAHAGSLPSLIAFDDSGGITTVQPGTPNSVRALSFPGGALPEWSPNGLELAFAVRETDQGLKIMLGDRNGKVLGTALSEPFDPTLATYGSGPLTWSPDGKQIAYWCAHATSTPVTTETEYQIDVCVVEVATGAHRLLAASRSDLFILHQTGCLCRMSWSPKGNVIALDLVHSFPCAPGPSCFQNEIGLVDVAKGTLSQLTNSGANDSSIEPQFSPDGSEIVYAHGTQQGTEVDIMSASGTFIRQVVAPSKATNGFQPQPTWSPDGKDILFGSPAAPANNGNIDLFSISAHGGHITQDTNTPADSVDSSWGPPVTTCTVPKLKGQTLAKAKKLIQRAGCVLGKITGPKKNRSSRRIVNQKPRANMDVAAGTKVNMQLR
jgi:Tol biopolymer transport system component